MKSFSKCFSVVSIFNSIKSFSYIISKMYVSQVIFFLLIILGFFFLSAIACFHVQWVFDLDYLIVNISCLCPGVIKAEQSTCPSGLIQDF